MTLSPSVPRLWATLGVTILVVVALAALLVRPGHDLEPTRSRAVNLDEPPTGAVTGAQAH
jgi:hypothetical protein